MVLLGGLGVLGIAVWLRPDPRGFGTHTQLGFDPCGLLVRTGLPCPTCGMTTAFAYTVRGQAWQAVKAQPGGFLLCVGLMAGVAISLITLINRGNVPGRLQRWVQMYYVFWLILIFVIGGWLIRMGIGLASGEYPMKFVPSG